MLQLSFKERSAGVMLALSFCLALFSTCARRTPKTQIDQAAYAQELSQWQQKRWADLKSETGWLTLVGLFWLKEGRNRVGIGPDNEIILPREKMPLNLGTFWLNNGMVRFEARSPSFT